MSRRWKLFLIFSIACGLLLRLVFTDDMEWKEDEYYDFAQTLRIGHTHPWPWTGMNSGVYLANPGMSIWVFVWLARIARATDPLALQRALGIVAVIGTAALIPFALFFVGRGNHPEPENDDREPWFWATALALVNPFAVFYQRKLWPEGFFPLLSTLALAGWWKRDRFMGAFVWGLFGAVLGQVHMGGFFYAFALFLWTVFFSSYSIPRKKTRWIAWFLGSCAGAWPLIPWFFEVIRHPAPGTVLSGTWGDVVQLKFWVFWITDPLGLALGNPLGLLRGNSIWAQISDFVRYPLVAGHATYLCGLAHAVVLLSGLAILLRGLGLNAKHTLEKRAKLRWIFARKVPAATFAEASALWGFGALLTATKVNIRRYYLTTAFPFEYLWLVRQAFTHPVRRDRARRLLAAIWIAQLLISVIFVGYVHVNNGATQGDYGEAYHLILEKHKTQPQTAPETPREEWPDLKLLPP